MIALTRNPKMKMMLRLIASVLIVAFIAYDIAWAYPDYGRNNLAVTALDKKDDVARLKTAFLVNLIDKNIISKKVPQVGSLMSLLIWLRSNLEGFEDFKIEPIISQDKKTLREIRIPIEKEGLIVRYYDSRHEPQDIPGYEDITDQITKTHKIARSTPIHRQILQKRTGSPANRGPGPVPIGEVSPIGETVRQSASGRRPSLTDEFVDTLLAGLRSQDRPTREGSIRILNEMLTPEQRERLRDVLEYVSGNPAREGELRQICLVLHNIRNRRVYEGLDEAEKFQRLERAGFNIRKIRESGIDPDTLMPLACNLITEAGRTYLSSWSDFSYMRTFLNEASSSIEIDGRSVQRLKPFRETFGVPTRRLKLMYWDVNFQRHDEFYDFAQRSIQFRGILKSGGYDLERYLKFDVAGRKRGLLRAVSGGSESIVTSSPPAVVEHPRKVTERGRLPVKNVYGAINEITRVVVASRIWPGAKFFYLTKAGSNVVLSHPAFGVPEDEGYFEEGLLEKTETDIRLCDFYSVKEKEREYQVVSLGESGPHDVWILSQRFADVLWLLSRAQVRGKRFTLGERIVIQHSQYSSRAGWLEKSDALADDVFKASVRYFGLDTTPKKIIIENLSRMRRLTYELKYGVAGGTFWCWANRVGIDDLRRIISGTRQSVRGVEDQPEPDERQTPSEEQQVPSDISQSQQPAFLKPIRTFLGNKLFKFILKGAIGVSAGLVVYGIFANLPWSISKDIQIVASTLSGVAFAFGKFLLPGRTWSL